MARFARRIFYYYFFNFCCLTPFFPFIFRPTIEPGHRQTSSWLSRMIGCTWFWNKHIRHLHISHNTTCLPRKNLYSRISVTRTLYITRTSRYLQVIYISLQILFYIILPSITRTPDNSNFFLYPLKIRIIGSRLYNVVSSGYCSRPKGN